MMSSSSKDYAVITYMPPFLDQSTYHCVDGEYPVGVVVGFAVMIMVGLGVGFNVGLAVIGDALGLAVGDALGTVGMYEQSWNAFQLKLALQHTTTVGNAVSHEPLLLLPHGCSPTQSATHLHLYLSKEKVDKRFRNAFYE
jgi:hypothetical protein